MPTYNEQGQVIVFEKCKKKFEFSKIILVSSVLLFLSQLVLATVFSIKEISLELFTYSIPSTAGVLGASIVFYLNKSKTENIYKGIIRLIMIKLQLRKYLPDDVYCKFEEEIASLESNLNYKIESEASESISQDINITNL